MKGGLKQERQDGRGEEHARDRRKEEEVTEDLGLVQIECYCCGEESWQRH